MKEKTQKIITSSDDQVAINNELENINKKQKLRNKVLQKMIETLNNEEVKNTTDLKNKNK